MKKNIFKRIILKAGVSLLSLGILLGSFVWVDPMQVSAAELVHDHEAVEPQNSVQLTDEERTFDVYVTPKNVEGKLHMGTDALNDPVTVTGTVGGKTVAYYVPTTYVYFGEIYDTVKNEYVPLLHRVLNNDTDNVGNSGAMFVLSEYASVTPTSFSPYRNYYESYDAYLTENVYDISNPYRMLNYYAADNFLGNYSVHFENLAEEIDYIRPVTVTDYLEVLDGVYGYDSNSSFQWEVDTAVKNKPYEAVDSEEATYINNEKFFLLSAEEMYKYVSQFPGTPVMATTAIGSDEYVKYWLRTGLDEDGISQSGNYVGIIDENGNVVPYDAGYEAYVRYGFNIETADIQFMYEIAPDRYRLTFLDPNYKEAIANADPENGVDDRFTAQVRDVRDGVVTVEVGKAIRNKSGTSYSNVDEALGVSVIIKDENGTVTHYAQIEDNLYGRNSSEDAGSISNSKSLVYFRLPEDFDYESDEIYVFWEMTQDAEESATFISNMVKLECLHGNSIPADCKNPAVCSKCGIYGDVNTNNHINVNTSVYYNDEDSDLHWNLCEDCGVRVNVEACIFGEDCSVDCVCGNSDYPASKHDFDLNGICVTNSKHFEPPTLQINDNFRRVNVKINNEGQYIAFARMYNSGKFDISYEFTIYIESDLDFAGINGFEPVGTEKYPFNGYVTSKNYTIKNIDYSTDGKYAGLFGCARYIEIRGLIVENCSFESEQYASVLVGRIVGNESDKIKFDGMKILNCYVNATSENGKEGILLAGACDNISVNDIYSYSVKNSNDGLVRFIADPENYEDISVTRAVCLYEENGEYGEKDAEAYASGEVAHIMGMGQRIGEEEYPTTDTPRIDDGTRVFKVSDCAGVTLRYTNEYLSVHYLYDYTEHRITEFYEFIWDERLPVADARVYCEACDSDILITAEMSMTEVYAPVRVDYIATVYINGEEFSSEPKRFIGTKIEDMIGMTNKVVEFDGSYISTDFVLDNHRLPVDPPANRGYIAYFLDPVSGEKLTEVSYDWYGQPYEAPAGVYLPGTYDLLVVGQNAYEGQEYVYEDALTITPIIVNVTVEDVYKYYDGNTSFVPEFTVDYEDYHYIFDVVVFDAPSAEVGTYDLEIGIDLWDDSYAEGIEVIFSRETVKGHIFPQLKPTVENKNYPTSFVYGESITDPVAENFTVTEGCQLSYTWYKVAETDYWGEPTKMIKLDTKPRDAGDYILRVTANSADYVTESYDFMIKIERKQLGVTIEGAEIIVDEYGREIYVVDMLQDVSFTIYGFAYDDTAESVGAYIDIYQNSYNLPEINDQYKFPYQPYSDDYDVIVYADLENYLVGGCNYERATQYITVRVNIPEAPTPVFGDDNLEDGEAQEFGVVYSWTHPISFRDDENVRFYGKVSLDGNEIESFELTDYEYLEENLWRMLKITEAGEYNVQINARYVSEDDYMSDYNVNIGFIVEFFEADGTSVDSIYNIGEYTVRVTSDSGEVREMDITVCREISMQIKAFDYEHSAGYPEFDIKNFIMEAGKVVILNHEIVDVKYEFYSNSGEISVKEIIVKDENGNDVSYLYKVTPYQSVDVHVFDSPCDSECNVYGCDYVRPAKHTGGAATCVSLAVCEDCGMEYGELEKHRHFSDNTVMTVNCDDMMTHLNVYACCGLAKETEPHVMAKAATCTTLAVCSECGWLYGELDPDNHSSDEMNYAASADDDKTHIAAHVCCGASFTENHSGGNATCFALADCEKCNTPYGEIDEDGHVNITYTAEDGDVHNAKCDDCENEWLEEHRGGNATCITLAVCECCEASYGTYDKDNHESDENKYVVRAENPSMHDYVHSCCNGFISKAYHSGGEANCASAAICEYCNEEYGNINASNHTSEETAYKQSLTDQNSHVKYRVCCGEELESEAHTGTDTANCTQGNICDICNIEYSEKIGHIYDDENDKQCNVCEKEVITHVIEVVVTESATDTDSETETDNDSETESDNDSEDTTESDTTDDIEQETDEKETSQSSNTEDEKETSQSSNTENEKETSQSSNTEDEKETSVNGNSSSEDDGCGSFVGVGTVAVVAVSAISGIVSFKKKKED